MVKQKPGKKFKYDLQAVLKVREIKEKKEQEKFAEKNREYLIEKEKEELIEKEKRNKEQELRDIFKKGPIANFDKIIRRRAHIDVLKDDLAAQVEKVIEANKKLDEQRARLIDSMKNKKVMQKHREKKLEEYNKLMQSLEMKFMDEIATQRFGRDKGWKRD